MKVSEHPTVLSNSILKVAPFQIGFSSSMDLCITNGQLSGSELNPGGNIVILAYVPL